MRALVMRSFGDELQQADVPTPDCPEHGAVIEVRATGVCRSDWHAWQGHDDAVRLPHVPGHEFAGVIRAVGRSVTGWRVGQRVTAPFVNACGNCPECERGRETVCIRQTQPGFDRWGSWADSVVVHHADVNLVALPDAIDDVTAASLGCRFATAYRAVRTIGAVRDGERVLVVGCGGVGLAAVMVASAAGASVIAVDPSPAARSLGVELGADAVLDVGEATPDALRSMTGGGVDLSVDALGRASALSLAFSSLRPGGRHVQVGLLLGADTMPAVDMGAVIARELTILGSHGMPARDYPPMLEEIAAGSLDPARLVGRTAALGEAGTWLRAMGGTSATAGTTVLTPRG